MNAHVPISEWAALFHRRSDPFKGMAMLKAYFDESGTHAGALVTAIGGFTADEALWKAFEVDWQANSRIIASPTFG